MAYLIFFKNLFLLAVLDLCCQVQTFCDYGKRGLLSSCTYVVLSLWWLPRLWNTVSNTVSQAW